MRGPDDALYYVYLCCCGEYLYSASELDFDTDIKLCCASVLPHNDLLFKYYHFCTYAAGIGRWCGADRAQLPSSYGRGCWCYVCNVVGGECGGRRRE
jgi:hypothetical protein